MKLNVNQKSNNKMAKTIWKFELETTDNQTIEMPIGSKILTVQTQNGKVCLWALVDPTVIKVKVFIDIFGTGHEIHYGENIIRNYLGTYQLQNGDLVFHVFERFFE